MDDEVLKVISKDLQLKSYSVDACIVGENNPLEYMYIFVEGSSMSIESTCRPFKRKLRGIGNFYGLELVYWVTNWTASHTPFPDKLPLSTSEVKVGIDNTGNAGVLVLSADDLKSIVSKFRCHFIKQTALPVNSEGKLSTFDPLAALRKVIELLSIQSIFVAYIYYILSDLILLSQSLSFLDARTSKYGPKKVGRNSL